MADIDIKVTGIEGIFTRLDKVAAGQYMREAMEASVIEIATYLKKYPPPPAAIQGPAVVPVRAFVTKGGSVVNIRANKMMGTGIAWMQAKDLRYRRTGKLGQSWTHSVQQTASELIGKVGTNLEYAPYVQNAVLQARIHQGRWRTDAAAVAYAGPRIIKRFREALERALR